VLPRLLTLLNRVLTGAYVPAQAQIGAGTKIAYGGAGLMIHPRSVVGKNCLLSPGVVVGGRSGVRQVPVIEDDVRIYPHAVLLGPIRVGRGCVVAANAVVVDSQPAGTVLVAPKATALQ